MIRSTGLAMRVRGLKTPQPMKGVRPIVVRASKATGSDLARLRGPASTSLPGSPHQRLTGLMGYLQQGTKR